MLLNEDFASLYSKLFELERGQFQGRVDQAEVLLGRMSEELHRRFTGNESVLLRAQQLVNYLFRDVEIRFTAKCLAENFTLSGTLLNRGGNCLGLSTLLCLLAINFDIPIRPALFEGHVACELIAGGDFHHIEMSRGGSFLRPQFIRMMYGQERGIPLSAEELFAVHLSNQAAFVLVPQNHHEAALVMLDQAITLFPRYCGAHINRATLLLHMRRLADADEGVDRVLALHPGPQYERTVRQLRSQIIGDTIRGIRSLRHSRIF